MRLFAKFILSTENLIKNPVTWSENQHFLVRWLLIALLVPAIGLSSIYLNENLGLVGSGLRGDSSEIEALQSQINKLHQQQIDEIANLTTELEELKVEREQGAGGGTESGSSAGQGVVGGVATAPQSTALYLPKTSEEIKVYMEARENSKVIAKLESDSIQFMIEKIDGWYKIEVDNITSGWIMEKFATPLP